MQKNINIVGHKSKMLEVGEKKNNINSAHAHLAT